jgi:hypothetical protein
MRPLALLKCIAKAAVKGVGNLAVLPLGDAAVGLIEGAWAEWTKEKVETERRAELESVVRMAANEFRRQVGEAVREAAAGHPPEVKEKITTFLERLPELARQRFSRPEDQPGASVPPGFRLDRPSDLASIFSDSRPAVTEGDDAHAPPAVTAADDVPRVTIRYSGGALTGQEHTYSGPAVLRFGREADCNPRLPPAGHGRVSRRHCFLEINPPDVRIRDLGSANGTFVNGHLIGKRPKGADPATEYESVEHTLSDGTEVRLSNQGQVAFTVHVFCPPLPSVRACSWCKAAVSEPGANRPGLFVCAECRADLRALVDGTGGRPGGRDERPQGVRDYEMLQELGRGGMGAVYMARHRKNGSPAAVKLMLPQVAADDRAVRMFQREIRNTMALNHRNVVRCLDHGYSQGAFFLVLEYCDGGSVQKLMESESRGGKLPVDEAVEIAVQALNGLEYAHRATVPSVQLKGGGYAEGVGLVHRDLKPANLFLSGRGSSRVVKVGDYGLAKGFDEAGLSGGTRTGTAAGTPEFMCREQIDPYACVGPVVDVWAMAASLYNMLTGRFPRDFPAGRDRWIVLIDDAPVPILKRNSKVPAKLAAVIDHALREDEMPFKSASELRQAIEDVS